MERNHRESPFYHQSGPLKSRPAAANNRSALSPVSSDFIMESRIEAAYRARQKKKLKLDQFQSEPGELIATSSDGSQWYIIMLSDRVRDRQCVINRMTPKGQLVIIEKTYPTRLHALKAIENYIRSERRSADIVDAEEE